MRLAVKPYTETAIKSVVVGMRAILDAVGDTLCFRTKPVAAPRITV